MTNSFFLIEGTNRCTQLRGNTGTHNAYIFTFHKWKKKRNAIGTHCISGAGP
ncbi:hypothetical protein PVAP13_5KG457114 [Panicum virgatum]|uniref:Uncharacterized protein n=1 Tax=Panicum virgatum TaxID=38727 RepID=A0A8T0SQ59_PANVG|nr:hypothetical protein PVAP13_5KG457114 [Panicum virgatum]